MKERDDLIPQIHRFEKKKHACHWRKKRTVESILCIEKSSAQTHGGYLLCPEVQNTKRNLLLSNFSSIYTLFIALETMRMAAVVRISSCMSTSSHTITWIGMQN